MSEYMDVYIRKGEKLSEEELDWLKGFQKAWERQSWRKVEEWFDFNGKVLDSFLFMEIIREYLRGGEKCFLREVEDIVLSADMSASEKVEEIKDVCRKFEFLEDLLDLFLICGRRVAVGSEYLDKDWVEYLGKEEWVKFEGGDEE